MLYNVNGVNWIGCGLSSVKKSKSEPKFKSEIYCGMVISNEDKCDTHGYVVHAYGVAPDINHH